jgi:hypothetical protein
VRGWPLAAVLITVLVLVFATAAGLYASGPEMTVDYGESYGGRICAQYEAAYYRELGRTRRNSRCIRWLPPARHSKVRRTSAYERIKGAITGEP